MKKIIFTAAVGSVLILLLSFAAYALEFDAEREGSRLSLFGTAEGNAFVSADITDPAGKRVYLNTVRSGADGKWVMGVLFDDSFEGGEYTIRVGSGDEIKDKVYTYKPNDDASIRSFSVNGVQGRISGSEISLTLPAGTDRNGLIAEFTSDKYAAVSVDGSPQVSGETRNNFTKPVIYHVVAENGKTSRDYTVRAELQKATSKSSGGGGGGGGYSSPVKNTPASTSNEAGMGIVVEAKQPLESAPPEDLSAAPEATGEYFTDMPSDHWAAGYVEALFDAGLVAGIGEDIFEPDRYVTREEFTKMICDALQLEVYEPDETSFKDVDMSAWYAPYIDALYYEELIKGISEDEFGIGQNITRQDMAVLLERCKNYLEVELTYKAELFEDDADIADYAREAVYDMKGINIIRGDENNYFHPAAPATRAEAAKMIYVLLRYADQI